MKVTLLTNEYPPYIYGGAGVHVDYLSRYLARIMEVEVRAFGDQQKNEFNLAVRGFDGWERLKTNTLPFTKVLHALSVNLAFNSEPVTGQVVHCHTWYTFFAGFLAKFLYSIPLVVTMHSLEPLRPWKEEQLQRGYTLSSWIERNAVEHADRVIAVSEEMKQDILKHYNVPEERVAVIHNGIDLDEYRPTSARNFLDAEQIDYPYILFVGRISRQKGIFQLIEAFNSLSDCNLHLILCAGAPDTPELEQELRRKVEGSSRIKWINRMVSKKDVIQLYSHAVLFVCPSIYEPFGIINLEAMACQTPVVATRVGGIKEVVIDGETGLLVAPDDPKQLAEAMRRVLEDSEMAARFGEAGRRRVEEYFGWDKIARKTKALYEGLI
ncbi:MAG TPA: glycogen synthase [Bacillota bacterium]|nr:glycogen synthase [Bacillota bacterium]HPT86580.1 glycogen synthase [Bacillota bacterium]